MQKEEREQDERGHEIWVKEGVTKRKSGAEEGKC